MKLIIQGTKNKKTTHNLMIRGWFFIRKIKQNDTMILLVNGGEQEIRTLDAFRHTRFPGVLLRPLGQLTKTLYAVRNLCAYINYEDRRLQPIY